MDYHTPKGVGPMPTSQAEAAWKKENTVVVTMRLQKNTDADILQYLDGKAKQTVIKAALREYMKNHEDRPE